MVVVSRDKLFNGNCSNRFLKLQKDFVDHHTNYKWYNMINPNNLVKYVTSFSIKVPFN